MFWISSYFSALLTFDFSSIVFPAGWSVLTMNVILGLLLTRPNNQSSPCVSLWTFMKHFNLQNWKRIKEIFLALSLESSLHIWKTAVGTRTEKNLRRGGGKKWLELKRTFCFLVCSWGGAAANFYLRRSRQVLELWELLLLLLWGVSSLSGHNIAINMKLAPKLRLHKFTLGWDPTSSHE